MLDFNKELFLQICKKYNVELSDKINEPVIRKNNNMLPYSELRKEINEILCDFFDRELECNKGGEFDIEWMECKTDDILDLIKRQGGNIL